MAAGKSSKAFDEKMSSVLAAIDSATSKSRCLSDDKGGLLPPSDNPVEERPQPSSPVPRRSRSPADGSSRHPKHETGRDHRERPREHHRTERDDGTRDGRSREEWKRPREHHKTERGGDRAWDRDGRSRERGYRGQRRFDGGRYSRRPAPDYVVNPSKWTKYDLADDGTEGLKRSGMSDDQVNKYAALQFLKEVRERKRESGDGGEEEEGEGRVVFRAPKKSRKEKTASIHEGEMAVGKEAVCAGGFGSSGVLKMPEYVVGGGEEQGGRGQRRGKRQVVGEGGDLGNGCKSEAVGVKLKSCVSLSHLAEEEDTD